MRLCACLALAASAAAVSAPPPGALFNLSSWQLQLPTSNGAGGVTIISMPALASYSSEYFYTNATTSAMTFWCPENGAHTSGSSYPRSELRQIPNWHFKGHSQLNVTMSVLKLPTGGSITIGQVHADGLSGHCSIIIELEFSDGEIVAHLRDSACKGVTKKVGSGVALGQSFSYSLTIDGTLATAATDSGGMAPYDCEVPRVPPPPPACPRRRRHRALPTRRYAPSLPPPPPQTRGRPLAASPPTSCRFTSRRAIMCRRPRPPPRMGASSRSSPSAWSWLPKMDAIMSLYRPLPPSLLTLNTHS